MKKKKKKKKYEAQTTKHRLIKKSGQGPTKENQIRYLFRDYQRLCLLKCIVERHTIGPV